MSKKLFIVAKVKVDPNKIDLAKPELLKLLEPTRNEEGCIKYDLHQDNNDPSLFFFYEIWESKDHLEKHLKSEHIQNHIKATEGLVTELTIHELDIL